MDLHENGGAGLAAASMTIISPANDQNNYAASGIGNYVNESSQNSIDFQSSSQDQIENLPEAQNSITVHSSTHPGQQDYYKSENDLPEGDRASVPEAISKGDEERAPSDDTAALFDQPKIEDNITEQNKAKTDEKPPEAATKKRVCDIVRVQKVLEELSAKHSGPDQASGARYKRQKISNDARSLILEYAKELSSAILEESCLLAKHRNSKELITADIKLIFGG
jgi:histone H3/H4